MKLKSISTDVKIISQYIFESNNYTLNETDLNGKIIDQYWTINPEKNNKKLYTHDNKHELKFYYYPELDIEGANELLFKSKEPTIIQTHAEIESFQDFEKLFARYSQQDYIYQINKTYPIPRWIKADYISKGCSNRDYDLNKMQDILLENENFRNIKIDWIPGYNQFDGATQGLWFEFYFDYEKNKKYIKNNKVRPHPYMVCKNFFDGLLNKKDKKNFKEIALCV